MSHRNIMKLNIIYTFLSITNVFIANSAEITNQNVPVLDYAGPMLSNHNNYYLPNIPIKPENEDIKERLTNFVLHNKPIPDSNTRILISPIVKSIHYVRENFPETLKNLGPGTNVASNNGYYGQKIPPYLGSNNNGDRTQLAGFSLPRNLPSPFINPNQGNLGKIQENIRPSNNGYYGQKMPPYLGSNNNGDRTQLAGFSLPRNQLSPFINPNQGNLGKVRENIAPSANQSKAAKRRSRTRKKSRSKLKRARNKNKHLKSKRKTGKQKSARKNTKLDIRHKKSKTSKKKKKKEKRTRKSNLHKKIPVKKDGSEITDRDGDNMMGFMTDPRTVKILSHQYNLLAQLMRRQNEQQEDKLDVTFPEESNDDFKNLIKEVEKDLKNEKFYHADPFNGQILTQATTVGKDYTPINIMAIGKKSIMKSIKLDPYIRRVMSIYNKKRKDYVKRVKEKKQKKGQLRTGK